VNRPTSSAATLKAKWMARFEAVVNAQDPATVGKIKWHDATHLYNSGYSPVEAATRYLSALRNS
jgi:hypothetical protein